MTDDTDKGARLEKLRSNLYRAERERDAWKGKPSEHYKMACILVEGLKKQIAALESSEGE